jgi:hydroxypyruvate reductase
MNGCTPEFRHLASLAGEVRRAVLAACDPAEAVDRAWPRDLRGPVRVLAVGKAAVPMARRAMARLQSEDLPNDATAPGACLVVTTPQAQTAVDGADVVVADHPLPTARNLAAAARVLAFVRAAPVDQPLLVLLSGGGSALLTAPAGGLTLDDVRAATGALLRSGATIREMNAVRKHCERLKGGKLARAIGADAGRAPGARPRVLVLVLSDVLGDPLDVISSGPLAPDPTTYADALDVLRRRGVAEDPALARVVEHLERGAGGGIVETPKAGDAAFDGVEHRVIAGNQHAGVAAREALLHAGIGRVKLVCGVQGEAARVGEDLVRDTIRYASEGSTSRGASHPVSAVVYAGETTVSVGAAGGRGGRNQELALAAAIEMGRSLPGADPRGLRLAVMTLATDGVDGPTDAAGGLVSSQTADDARGRGIDLEAALAAHDSYHALDALSCLVRTGPTGTNVNDIAIGMAWEASAPGTPR